jgi:hypothetical protein
MVDPGIDDPRRPWGYQPKSTVLIGVPYQPEFAQVTFDGAIYVRNQAELCFFYGQPLRPLMARQKHFMEGWIPIVGYEWREGPIAYEIEMFGAVPEGEDAGYTVQFVRLRMRNTGARLATGVLAAAMRNSGEDKRWLQWAKAAPFSPNWKYEMTGDSALRDGRLVYMFSGVPKREAVPGTAYEKPFIGSEHYVTSRAEVCLVRYEKSLKPGESETAYFKMPLFPIPVTERARIERVRAAQFDDYRARTVRYWRELLAGGAVFEFPEARVNEAARAGLVHLILATVQEGPVPHDLMGKKEKGARFQTDGLNYPGFFAGTWVEERLLYDVSGHPEFIGPSMDWLIENDLGKLPPGGVAPSDWEEWPGLGRLIQCLAHHYIMSRDKAYARKVFPGLSLAISILKNGLASTPTGLSPEVGAYDGEMIKGYYTGDNLWGLLGLRSAVQLAREIGEDSSAASWLKLHDELYSAFIKALQATSGDDGYVPTGLYKFMVGPEARQGMPPEIFNNDWENIALVYPSEALEPFDPRVTATLNRIHRQHYREGILGYRNRRGANMHGYVGYNMVYQYTARGEQAAALVDLYQLLLHCGPAHEIWEQGPRSWTNRDPDEWTAPHAWAAARMALAIRNMLVLEKGGRAGLDPGQRDLHLFSVTSPAWVIPGKQVAIRNAVTEMGKISAAMRFAPAGASVTIQAEWHHPPRNLVVHVPYFLELISFQTDAKRSVRDGDTIVLSPDATQLSLRWRPKKGVHEGTFQRLLTAYREEPTIRMDGVNYVVVPAPPAVLTEAEGKHPAEPLSFDVLVKAFRHEYARRYAEYLKAGGTPEPVEAPRMLSAEERRQAFTKQYGVALRKAGTQ